MFSSLENLQPILTSKTRNGAFNSVEEPDLFVCYRSAAGIQEHIRQNCNIYIIYDVTGVTGCIFGVFDLQPSCAAPKSPIQEPSGSLT
jgi:hypothetical protein